SSGSATELTLTATTIELEGSVTLGSSSDSSITANGPVSANEGIVLYNSLESGTDGEDITFSFKEGSSLKNYQIQSAGDINLLAGHTDTAPASPAQLLIGGSDATTGGDVTINAGKATDGTEGTVYIGALNTDSVILGASDVPVHVSGDFSIGGAINIQEELSFGDDDSDEYILMRTPASSGTGGDFELRAGDATATGDGGDLYLNAGHGDVSGTTGSVYVGRSFEDVMYNAAAVEIGYYSDSSDHCEVSIEGALTLEGSSVTLSPASGATEYAIAMEDADGVDGVNLEIIGQSTSTVTGTYNGGDIKIAGGSVEDGNAGVAGSVYVDAGATSTGTAGAVKIGTDAATTSVEIGFSTSDLAGRTALTVSSDTMTVTGSATFDEGLTVTNTVTCDDMTVGAIDGSGAVLSISGYTATTDADGGDVIINP
ncbi:hypothetical protein KIPB_010887, partial [Kipferlia bialata]